MKLTTQEILAKINIIVGHMQDFKKDNSFNMDLSFYDATLKELRDLRDGFIKRTKEVV